MQVGEIINDGGVQWRVRDLKSGGGVQIGTIMPFLALLPPAGWLACDTGALVSRATYAELWTWVQDNAPLVTEAEWEIMAAAQTSVGYYSDGDGSTTFRLPRLVDFVRGADSANGRDVGAWQEDEFKSHTHTYTGEISGNTYDRYDSGGSQTNFISENTGSTGGDETRPKNIAMLYCVKAFDAVVNEGLIDVTELANEVAGKQNQMLYALIVDEKPSGTHGGTFTAGAWRTRDLNTIKINEGNFVTLAGNQITLPAGVYQLKAVCPAERVSQHQARLYDVSNSSVIDYGSSSNSPANTSYYPAGSNSVVTCRFTLSSSTAIEMQHICASTLATLGFGQGHSFDSINIFTVVEIWKEA